MNLLEVFIERNHLDPCGTMDTLQDCGLVSDCCVWPADVAHPDCLRAIGWLMAQRKAS